MSKSFREVCREVEDEYLAGPHDLQDLMFDRFSKYFRDLLEHGYIKKEQKRQKKKKKSTWSAKDSVSKKDRARNFKTRMDKHRSRPLY